ncbi:MAG: hypothetical protein J6Y29_00690 [Clostridiales bacterium]|nr:hypothetical protein [Clostridiales bacterium]
MSLNLDDLKANIERGREKGNNGEVLFDIKMYAKDESKLDILNKLDNIFKTQLVQKDLVLTRVPVQIGKVTVVEKENLYFVKLRIKDSDETTNISKKYFCIDKNGRNEEISREQYNKIMKNRFKKTEIKDIGYSIGDRELYEDIHADMTHAKENLAKKLENRKTYLSKIFAKFREIIDKLEVKKLTNKVYQFVKSFQKEFTYKEFTKKIEPLKDWHMNKDKKKGKGISL